MSSEQILSNARIVTAEREFLGTLLLRDGLFKLGISERLKYAVLGVLFVPLFFVVIRTLFKGSDRQSKMYATQHQKHVEEGSKQ